MKKETILKAMTDINDDFILEAAPKGYMPKEKKAFSWFNMKVLAGAFAVLLMAILLPQVLKPGQNVPGGSGDVELVRPYETVESMAQAEQITGFSMDYPDTFLEWTSSEINVYNKEMIDVAYTDANEQIMMHVRKAEGEEDISGDFNAYGFETEINGGNYKVTVKGNDGRVHLMTWIRSGYSYSISLTEGISLDDAARIVSDIH